MLLKYPKHFYEEIRREIAISQFQHDFRKLFPKLTQEDFRKIDQNIKEWFEGEKFELEAVHDFWNLLGGFARGLKLKSLLSWVTAENVAWTKTEVPTRKIQITWDFPGLEFMGRAPYCAGDVMDKLHTKEMSALKKELRINSDARSRKFAPRDHFPIILFNDIRGGVIDSKPGFYVLEGNRRTVKSIIHDRQKTLAYVGSFKNADDLWPENYWFNTGMLRDLIFLAIGYHKEKDDKAFDVVRKSYQLLLRDFDVARIATIDKSFKNFERDEKLLLDIMLEDLK